VSAPPLSPRDPVVVLGAGPCGLGAARRLAEWGHEEWLVLEAADGPGGLARSYRDPEGFTWDLGAHVQFSHYEYFDRAMDEALAEDEWLPRTRDTWVRLGADLDVPFPFQYHLHRLPPELRERCVAALREAAAAPAGEVANFREWILARFGSGIAEAFLFPYNEKIWARDPAELSVAWTADRVAPVDLARVERGLATGEDAPDWGPNARFRYPRRGGAGAVWSRLGERLGAGRARFGTRAVAVDLDARRLRLEGGEEVEYAALVSTVPLDLLAGMSGEPRLVAAAERLVHTVVDVFGARLRGPGAQALTGRTWMYHPGPEAPFYRSTMLSELSPRNAPDGCSSLLLEVGHRAGEEPEVEAVEAAVRAGLRETELVPPSNELLGLWHRRLPHGYPVPTLGRDEALGVLLPELAAHGVHSRGRFGAWTYEVSNQDHSFMQGVEVVDRLLRGDPEPTLADPGAVNAGGRRPAPPPPG
jgi:protoporphyrinogen oxidase